MCNATRPKKRTFARSGAVNKLIYDHKMSRLDIITKRTAGADADNICNSKPFERVNVGSVRDAARRVDMPTSMAGQKCHVDALQSSSQYLIGWSTPRAFDFLPCWILQSVYIIKSRSADDPNFCVLHGQNSLKKAFT